LAEVMAAEYIRIQKWLMVFGVAISECLTNQVSFALHILSDVKKSECKKAVNKQ
jgi:hypothetical protein